MSSETLPKLFVGDLDAGRELRDNLSDLGVQVDLWWSYKHQAHEPVLEVNPPVSGAEEIIKLARTAKIIPVPDEII